MDMQKQVRLWQLISPALPVGSFSYSQGLEYAIESGLLKTEADVQSWLSQQLQAGLARLDGPVLLRQIQNWQKQRIDQVEHWNRVILAFRESHELYDEDCQIGYALSRLLTDLEIKDAERWLGKNNNGQKVSYVTMFALICQRWEIKPEDALAGFFWAWCENMVAAAVKLLPMGQTAGQKMLLVLGNEIESAVSTAKVLEDDEIGSVLPGVAMASAFHETQYSRLFRS